MAITRNVPRRELINVHQVEGDKNAIIYLKNADHEVVEGLFYTAKKYGKTTFIFSGSQYDILRNKDFSFTIQLSEDQELTPESFV